MKQFLFISFLCFFLFSCGANNNEKTAEHRAIDSATSKNSNAYTAVKDTSWKTIKASAAFPSDSLTPGQTTADSWRISGFDDPEGFKAFFKEYKKWVAEDNIDSIAAHIRFPLGNCKSPEIFKKQYATYFNNKVKQSALQQNTEKFFVNYNGAMTGDGELWFTDVNGKYFVIAINNE